MKSKTISIKLMGSDLKKWDELRKSKARARDIFRAGLYKDEVKVNEVDKNGEVLTNEHDEVGAPIVVNSQWLASNGKKIDLEADLPDEAEVEFPEVQMPKRTYEDLVNPVGVKPEKKNTFEGA